MKDVFCDSTDEILSDLRKMGKLAEKAVFTAVDSLITMDGDKAKMVVDGDDEVDNLEIELEQRCIELCGCNGLSKEDLRTVGAFLKVITDLERIADHATDIAEIALRLVNSGKPIMGPTDNIVKLTTLTTIMLKDGLKAFFEGDARLAKDVILSDTGVDDTYELMYMEQLQYLSKGRGMAKTSQAIDLMLVARYLERIADHATNLGEYAIYMVTGERVAHQKLAPYPARPVPEDSSKSIGLLERLFGSKKEQ